MSYNALQPLPRSVPLSYVREIPAPPGWVAYYASPPGEEPSVLANPVILWAVVRIGISDLAAGAMLALDAVEAAVDQLAAGATSETMASLTQVEQAASDAYASALEEATDSASVDELRPVVCTRSGALVDMLDIPLEFLCLLGPGMDHPAYLRGAIKLLRPDLLPVSDETPLPPTTTN